MHSPVRKGWLLLTSGVQRSLFPLDASASEPEPASTGASDEAPAAARAGGSGSRVMWVGPDVMSCQPSSALLALEEENCPTAEHVSQTPRLVPNAAQTSQTGSPGHSHQTFPFSLLAHL